MPAKRITGPSRGAPSPAAERMRRYRARQRAAGLTLKRRWVPDGVTEHGAPPYSDHRVVEARSLALHCLIARKLSRDPRLLDRARRTLERWLRARGGAAPPALLEWREILERRWDEVAAILVDPSEHATRLRQSTPFAGILTTTERRKVYDAFRA